MHPGLLAAALLLGAQQQPPAPPSGTTVTLHVRVFDGAEDVTAETRVIVFRAGERQDAIAQSRAGMPLEARVPAGFYDAQAIREQNGRVLKIRWAERLVVMAYPDEGGHHLEVVNFQTGYGALEIRGHEERAPDVALFRAGVHTDEAARRLDVGAIALFVVPAARYDVRVRQGGSTTWHPGVEVPPDRTRFWIVP